MWQLFAASNTQRQPVWLDGAMVCGAMAMVVTLYNLTMCVSRPAVWRWRYKTRLGYRLRHGIPWAGLVFAILAGVLGAGAEVPLVMGLLAFVLDTRGLSWCFGARVHRADASGGTDSSWTGFVIPEEFRDLPEAVEVRRLDAEFTDACEAEHEALKAGMMRSSPEVFNGVSQKATRLARELKAAKQAFDLATGEPGPAPLPPEVMEEIRGRFAGEDGMRVFLILGRTMAYLRRQSPGDHSRVMFCILKLADGDADRLAEMATLARNDWRDVIVAADGMGKNKESY